MSAECTNNLIYSFVAILLPLEPLACMDMAQLLLRRWRGSMSNSVLCIMLLQSEPVKWSDH